MALPVWGNLEKSQVDNETIEEAIDRRIQAHEDDPDAHIETGESLESHKSSEVIDHVRESIVADKIGDGEIIGITTGFIIFNTIFESIDGYAKTGNIGFAADVLEIKTGANTNDSASLYKRLPPEIYGATWDKNRILEVNFSTDSGVEIECDIIIGDRGIKRHIGFKIVNGQVGATIGDGTDETTFGFAGVHPSNNTKGRIVYTAGEKCEFYINGVLKHTFTENLPSGLTDAHFVINAYIKTTENIEKNLYLSSWDFKQDI